VKKEIAFNKLFWLFEIVGAVFAEMSVAFCRDDDFAVAYICAAFCFFMCVLPVVFIPFFYLFDTDGVTLCYIFLPNERYLWKNIYGIEVRSVGSSDVSIFDIIFRIYKIDGYVEGKNRFYMIGEVAKSTRTKKLIGKYWDGQVEGYFFDNANSWIAKNFGRKKIQKKGLVIDDALEAERAARKDVSACINMFTDRVGQYNLVMMPEYTYVTRDFEESASRPLERYTYKVTVNISELNETNKERIVSWSEDLVYVRITKTAYRAVKKRGAINSLSETLEIILDEIGKNGFKSFGV